MLEPVVTPKTPPLPQQPPPRPHSSSSSSTYTTKSLIKYKSDFKHCNGNFKRRHLFTTSLSLIAVAPLLQHDADARGLFQMPPLRLTNRYFLVRAGESDYESLGVINTNPVAKTSMDSGLSERGKKQAVKSAYELKAMGACDRGCWIWPSITQRSYQAAEIIAAVNGIARRSECMNNVNYTIVRLEG